MIHNQLISSLNKEKQIKNIIFDMDGTIINTSKATIKACNEIAIKFGLPLLESEEIVGQIGWPVPEFFYRLYPNFDRNLVDQYGNEAVRMEQELMLKLGKKILFPGILELLSKLKSNNFYLCIASTGTTDHVNIALDTAEIKSTFDVIKCNEPVKINMVKDIMDKGPKGDWIIVGDRRKDFEAGFANNILTVGAAYGFGTKEEQDMFNLIIDKPLDLIKILA